MLDKYLNKITCGDTIDCDLCKSCYDKLLKQTKDFVGEKK